MNSFSNLLRQGFFESTIFSALRRPRPKVSPRTIMKRKDAKRTRHSNKFSSETTGEKPLHTWMDPKRLKALAQSYQEIRNNHRLTRNIDKKDIPELKEKGEKFSAIMYKKWLEEKHMFDKAVEKRDEAFKECEKLPFFLKEEIKSIEERARVQFDIPEEHLFANLYYEQLMRILPDEHADRIQVSLRLQAVATDTLGMGA